MCITIIGRVANGARDLPRSLSTDAMNVPSHAADASSCTYTSNASSDVLLADSENLSVLACFTIMAKELLRCVHLEELVVWATAATRGWIAQALVSRVSCARTFAATRS